jgi:hypothetical protein
MRSNKKHIHFSSILLLIIYAVSICTNFLFHQHTHQNTVAFTKATPCEKTIYFGQINHTCGHNKHISKTLKKCSLCDHHSNILFSYEFSTHSFKKQFNTSQYFQFHNLHLAKYNSLYFNKGPPIV